DPRKSNDAQVREVRKLLAEGMAHRASDALIQLMKHPDLRVRQAAQFALAERGPEAIEPLQHLATDGANRLERLHAIWCLGQIARKNPDVLTALLGLLEDSDSEVRAQLSKVLGESGAETTVDRLAPLLRDREPRVRFFAALSIGKLIHRRKQAPPPGVSDL